MKLLYAWAELLLPPLLYPIRLTLFYLLHRRAIPDDYGGGYDDDDEEVRLRRRCRGQPVQSQYLLLGCAVCSAEERPEGRSRVAEAVAVVVVVVVGLRFGIEVGVWYVRRSRRNRTRLLKLL